MCNVISSEPEIRARRANCHPAQAQDQLLVKRRSWGMARLQPAYLQCLHSAQRCRQYSGDCHQHPIAGAVPKALLHPPYPGFDNPAVRCCAVWVQLAAVRSTCRSSRRRSVLARRDTCTHRHCWHRAYQSAVMQLPSPWPGSCAGCCLHCRRRLDARLKARAQGSAVDCIRTMGWKSELAFVHRSSP